jgi:hypothetical protein
MAKADENGEIKTICYYESGKEMNGPAESKGFSDLDLANDSSTNGTTTHIQSQTNKTKTKNQNVQNSNSGITKERDNFNEVIDDKLTYYGDLSYRSQLTQKGRFFIEDNKDRRKSPLIQSRDEQFFPVYSLKQLAKKEKHTFEVLNDLGLNTTAYPGSKKLKVNIDIVESFLAHPDTELHMNVMGQAREPIAMLLNRVHGNYPIKNHINTFEWRPEISSYNPYITQYIAEEYQIANFERSNSTSISYEDVNSNSKTNIGPIFGKNETATSTIMVNDVNSEL